MLLASVTDIILSRLATSAKQCRDPCSGPQRTQQITGSAFQIYFHPDWQIGNVFFDRPIMASNQILVHRWGPRIRILVLFSVLQTDLTGVWFFLWCRLLLYRSEWISV